MPRPKLSNLSVEQLVKELNRRREKLSDLIRQRDALTAQIESLQVLAGGAPAAAPVKAARRGRPPKALAPVKRGARRTLAAFVQEALAAAKGGLKINEIEQKVRAAGYVTKAAKLYNPIFAVLSKGGFQKIAKGVYVSQGAQGRGKSAAGPRVRDKRRKYPETAEQFISRMAQGKGATTREINQAWKASRKGRADKMLNVMTTAGKLKRTREGRGSRYTIA